RPQRCEGRLLELGTDHGAPGSAWRVDLVHGPAGGQFVLLQCLWLHAAQRHKARLLAAVDPTPQLANLTISGGRLNALNALEEDGVPPNAVTDLAAGG